MDVPWLQNYDPLGNRTFSTLLAALPVVVLLGSIGLAKIRIHIAAVLGLAVALAIAIGIFIMPWPLALATAGFGAAYGLFPIGWLILNVMFLYQLTVKDGRFELLRSSLANLAPDPRVQVILIAFSLGAFIEGVAGFGTPVAITAAILIQLGFHPLHASGLALIANTAPVAFGSLGIPIVTLSQVTGMDPQLLSRMVGRQLPFFSVLIPFWVVTAFSGWRGMLAVWPAALTAGMAFAIPQFLVSNFHGPWLVDVVSASSSIVAMVILLRFWQPKTVWKFAHEAGRTSGQIEDPGAPAIQKVSRRDIYRAWQPWLILCVFIFVWGLPCIKQFLNGLSSMKVEVPGLHMLVNRMPPVAGKPSPEKAVFDFNWISATGTGILLAGLLAGAFMRVSPRTMLRVYWETIKKIRLSLLTITAMLALGHVTKYSGMDATLGIALAHTGGLYPFFGTLLGWVGVAITGSDTASNVLFGSLQKITAEQTGLSPILMGAANSSGGVMGKMIDAQSIVVASTATTWYGQEGHILRYVFFHSMALAALVGLLVYLQAYVVPFTHMVVR